MEMEGGVGELLGDSDVRVGGDGDTAAQPLSRKEAKSKSLWTREHRDMVVNAFLWNG